MGAIDDILAGIDPDQLGAALGTDPETARNAAAAVIPTLINGLQANAGTADGASSLMDALGQHAGSGLYGDTVDLNAVDTGDGQKIVAHALADDPSRLQAVSGLGGGLLSKLLPLLAPIVMSYLAKRLGMGGAAAQTQASGGSGEILGDLLGGLLGGGGLGGGTASGGGLGDILGQILGGGAAQPSGVPAGVDTGAGGAHAGADGDLGGVFNAPGNTGGMQMPSGGDSASAAQRPAPQQPGSGDILGGLLGQILGR
jgi:hypothetical protein